MPPQPQDPATNLLTLLMLHKQFMPMIQPEFTVAACLLAAVLWLRWPVARAAPRAMTAFLGLLTLQAIFPQTYVPGNGVLTMVREVQLAPIAGGLMILMMPWALPEWRVMRASAFKRHWSQARALRGRA